MIKSFLVFILLFTSNISADVALFIPSFTNMDHYSEEYKECYSDPHWTIVSMSICMNEEADRQDALLNKEYKRTLKNLSDSRKKQLKNAHKAWVKYRNANCAWYNNIDGGTSAIVSGGQCYLNMTVSRLVEMNTEGFYD